MARLLCLLLLLPAWAPAGEWGPFETPGHPVTAEVAAPPRVPEAARAPLPIRAYRVASRFQGPRCPHRPSCSTYAAEAIRRHGPFLGSFLGVARLLRGARSSALRPLERTESGALLDPLEESTFFLDARRP